MSWEMKQLMKSSQIPGNKMDTHNLATLFGPNVLHRTKSALDKEGSAESAESVEQSKEVIEVVKDMIDNHHELYEVSLTTKTIAIHFLFFFIRVVLQVHIFSLADAMKTSWSLVQVCSQDQQLGVEVFIIWPGLVSKSCKMWALLQDVGWSAVRFNAGTQCRIF